MDVIFQEENSPVHFLPKKLMKLYFACKKSLVDLRISCEFALKD